MSKYIDADKLVAEIKRQKKSIENATGDYAEGRRLELENLHKLITSLQQEQTVVGFEDKFANFLERKDAELGANSWSEEDLRELAEYFYFNNKQPEVDLVKLKNKAELIANGIMIGVQGNKYHTCIYDKASNDFNHSHLLRAALKGLELGLNARKEE